MVLALFTPFMPVAVFLRALRVSVVKDFGLRYIAFHSIQLEVSSVVKALDL